MAANKFQRHSQSATVRWARLSFPNVWEPKAVMLEGSPSGAARFSALVVLTDKDVEKIRKIEQEVVKQSWPAGLPEGIRVKSCLRKGEVARPGDANLEGKHFLSANSVPRYPKGNTNPDDPANAGVVEDARPKVYVKDAKTGRIMETNDRSLIYSGCETHVDISVYTTQKSADAPQVNIGLNGIMLTGRKAGRFDNRRTAEQAFGDIDDDAAAPPMDEMEDAPPMDEEEPAAAQEEASDDDLSQYGL